MQRGKGSGSSVVDHGSVHLVADQPCVGAFHGFRQGVQHFLCGDVAGGVVWAVEDDHAGTGSDRVGQAVGVHLASGIQQRDAHDGGVVQFGHWGVQVVTWILHHNFIARMEQRGHGCEEHTGCACPNGDFGVCIVARTTLVYVRDPPSQLRVARHRRVLVVPRFQGLRHGHPQGRRGGEVRKSLGNVECATFGGECRHLRENGGAHVRHFGARHARARCTHRMTANLTTAPSLPFRSVAKAKYTPYGAGCPLSRRPSQVARPPSLRSSAMRFPVTSVMCTVLW